MDYIAHQAPLSMGFSRQEYWSGLPFFFPGDLPNAGVEPGFPTLQADPLPSEPSRALIIFYVQIQGWQCDLQIFSLYCRFIFSFS